ncbi:MAG: trypsin-like peptidase domain-containing protein [Actinomycetia bacterium]|nr:trypsin-like peptidase domain-containing protein [Actinomycetes bacterium]
MPVLRRLLLPALCTAVLAVAAALLPGGVHVPSSRGWTNQAAARFWTPERMADSMPASGLPSDPGDPPDPVTPPDADIGSLATIGTAVHFEGIPTVGMLFSVGSDLAAHFCTASVVHSPGRDLLLTAAHCEGGSHLGFVPDYRAGSGAQPYGIWAVDREFTDPHWTPDDDAASNYDFAFATVSPGPHGERLEDVTGANRLARTPGYRNRVTVIGYPHGADDPSDQAVTCTTTTGRLEGEQQLQMDCEGFYSGTSGSPWILDYTSRTHSGTVIGVIGGLDGGGTTDRISYSPFLGDAAFALYRTATQSG